MASYNKICLLCNKTMESLEFLRKHVVEEHPKCMFTPTLKRKFVSQATESYCGGQTQVFEKLLIPEVAAVFGLGDSDSYYGMPENDGCGIDEEHEQKGELKTPPSTYVELVERLIMTQQEMPVSQMRAPLDDYPVDEGDDHEFINVDMSYEEGVLTQADNAEFCFDYDKAIKEMAEKDVAGQEILINPYSPIAVPNSPALPSDEFAEVKKIVANCQDQMVQHFRTVEDCFKPMPDKCSETNGKKLSAANVLMHKAEKVFQMLDRVLKNNKVVWDDEVSDLELGSILDATQKQIVEHESLPSPSLLVPAVVVIEDPIALDYTQSQALDFSKSTHPKLVVKHDVQSQAFDFTVKKVRFLEDAKDELPSTSSDTAHSFAFPSMPKKRSLDEISMPIPPKKVLVVSSDDEDEHVR